MTSERIRQRFTFSAKLLGGLLVCIYWTNNLIFVQKYPNDVADQSQSVTHALTGQDVGHLFPRATSNKARLLQGGVMPVMMFFVLLIPNVFLAILFFSKYSFNLSKISKAQFAFFVSLLGTASSNNRHSNADSSSNLSQVDPFSFNAPNKMEQEEKAPSDREVDLHSDTESNSSVSDDQVNDVYEKFLQNHTKTGGRARMLRLLQSIKDLIYNRRVESPSYKLFKRARRQFHVGSLLSIISRLTIVVVIISYIFPDNAAYVLLFRLFTSLHYPTVFYTFWRMLFYVSPFILSRVGIPKFDGVEMSRMKSKGRGRTSGTTLLLDWKLYFTIETWKYLLAFGTVLVIEGVPLILGMTETFTHNPPLYFAVVEQDVSGVFLYVFDFFMVWYIRVETRLLKDKYQFEIRAKRRSTRLEYALQLENHIKMEPESSLPCSLIQDPTVYSSWERCMLTSIPLVANCRIFVFPAVLLWARYITLCGNLDVSYSYALFFTSSLWLYVTIRKMHESVSHSLIFNGAFISIFFSVFASLVTADNVPDNITFLIISLVLCLAALIVLRDVKDFFENVARSCWGSGTSALTSVIAWFRRLFAFYPKEWTYLLAFLSFAPLVIYCNVEYPIVVVWFLSYGLFLYSFYLLYSTRYPCDICLLDTVVKEDVPSSVDDGDDGAYLSDGDDINGENEEGEEEVYRIASFRSKEVSLGDYTPLLEEQPDLNDPAAGKKEGDLSEGELATMKQDAFDNMSYYIDFEDSFIRFPPDFWESLFLTDYDYKVSVSFHQVRERLFGCSRLERPANHMTWWSSMVSSLNTAWAWIKKKCLCSCCKRKEQVVISSGLRGERLSDDNVIVPQRLYIAVWSALGLSFAILCCMVVLLSWVAWAPLVAVMNQMYQEAVDLYVFPSYMVHNFMYDLPDLSRMGLLFSAISFLQARLLSWGGIDVTFYMAVASIGLSTVLMLAFLVVLYVAKSIVSQYQRDMRRLRRGDYFFDLNLFRMIDSTQFVGYQISHLLFSFVVSSIILSLTITVFIVLLFVNRFRSIFFRYLLEWGSYALSVFVLIRLIRYATVRTYHAEDGSRRFIRSWTYVDYFNIFIYFFTGIYLVVIRMLNLPFMLITDLWRLDRSILPKSQEHHDPGYASYVGMLMEDHAHNNPIVVSFVHVVVAERLQCLQILRRDLGLLKRETLSDISSLRQVDVEDEDAVDPKKQEYAIKRMSNSQRMQSMVDLIGPNVDHYRVVARVEELCDTDRNALIMTATRFVRSKQLRFRWWLFFHLSQSRILTAYRRHNISLKKKEKND